MFKEYGQKVREVKKISVVIIEKKFKEKINKTL